MQNPFEITGPGEFITQYGELAVVLAVVGDQAFGYVEDADGRRIAEDWYVDTGKTMPDRYSYDDIVGVWIEKKEEEAMHNLFTITGPGEFVTKNGELAVIFAIVDDQAFGYVEDGTGYRISEDWDIATGRTVPDRYSYDDIVGIWAPPARVKMYMYRTATGEVRGFDGMHNFIGWKLLGKGELVEGEGLDDE